MPIRSPRGRAAAYRALWQWPLRSPARLGFTMAAVLAAVVGISTALSALNPPAGPVRAAPAASTTETRTSTPARTASPTPSPTATPTALPPLPELAPTTLPLASAPDAALRVAAQWSAAWLRPPAGTPAAQWLDGLRPFTTNEYLGVLATVDPVAIPATVVTGPAAPVRVAASSVDVDVPTDALTLRLVVVRTETGEWRVTEHDRATPR